MKAKLIAIVALVAALTAGSQQASAQKYTRVIYDSIQSVVNNRPELFSALTARFADADTTLTSDELAIVYYGHAFTPQYDPAAQYPELMEAFNAGDLNLAITLADDELRRNPVALPVLFKLYGCCVTSDVPRHQARSLDVRNKIVMLCDLIFSTGTGVTPYTPWLVISEADMNEMLLKYLYINELIDTSDIGDGKAVKCRIDDVDDDVIFYFDLKLPRTFLLKKSFNKK